MLSDITVVAGASRKIFFPALFAAFGLAACGGGDTASGTTTASSYSVTTPDHELMVAGCDCGSTDPNAPCVANALDVTVRATYSAPGTSAVYTDASFHWKFNAGGGPTYCGRFANGDYWVAPPIGDTVTVTAVTGNGAISLDDNPVIEAIGLLDGSRNYGNHAAENNLLPALPRAFRGITSLVAAKQRNEAADGECGTPAIVGECVDAYHVVTVLSAVPEQAGANTLRPSLNGPKRLLTLADFDFDRLPASPLLHGTDAAGLEEIRRRWSHSTEIFGLRTFVNGKGFTYSEGGRAFRAHILHDEYASGMAVAFNSDLMVVFSDDQPLAEKRAALAAMLTFGLDLYQARFHPPAGAIRGWPSGAGQHNGQLLPAALAAALMRDPTYADVMRTVAPNTHAANETERGPGELRQIHQGRDGVLIWGDTPSLNPVQYHGAYWGEMLQSQCFDGAPGTWPGHETCKIAYGSKTQTDPYGYIDGPPSNPGQAYMLITTGVQRAIVASMFLMPELCATINSPELIAFVDRVSNTGVQAAPDPCAAPDPREDPSQCDAYRNQGCTYYGITWGPVNPTLANSACIHGTGRFTSKHGKPLAMVYTTRQVESNWAALRGTAPSCLP